MKPYIFILAALALSTACPAEDFYAKPMPAPAIDGVIAAEEWQQAARYETFSSFGRTPEKSVPVATTAWIGYDADHLYIAFRCIIRQGIPLRLEAKENDSNISHDDSVEVFLNGSPADKIYLQLGQSADGVRFDAEVKGSASQVNRKWTSALWRNAAKHNADYFDAEFAIPLKMIPFDGSGFLRFNLTRTVRAGGNANLTLIPMSGDGWHQPEKFARLLVPAIAPYSEITAERPQEQPVVMGTNHFRSVLHNHTKELRNAVITINDAAREFTLPPQSKQNVDIPWKCASSTGVFSWKLSSNGKEIYNSAPEAYAVANGFCIIPPVSYSQDEVICNLRVFHEKAELEKSSVRVKLKRNGKSIPAFEIKPFGEELRLGKQEPGWYEAEISVVSDTGALLFQEKADFHVVHYFL